MAFQSGLKIREEIDRALALQKVRVRVALEFDNIETIKRAIEIGAGVSLLPEPTIAREIESGSLVQIPLEGVALERTLGIIHRRDRKLNETAQQFIKLLQSQSSIRGVCKQTRGHGGHRRKWPCDESRGQWRLPSAQL